MTNFLNHQRNNIYYYSFLGLIVLAGLFFRLKGLGKWPLTVDEYYVLESVKNILNHGLPQFTGGGYYDRGILYQYLIAGLLLLGVKAEFAGRIITVIANIITIVPFYLISKRLSGKLITAVLVFIFTFSVWEVEFARFARMYSPFQMIFIWYIYFLFKFLMDGDKKTFKWLFILSFISIFIYEGSIFLSLLNFIPIIWNPQTKSIELSIFKNKNIKFSYIFITLLIVAFTYIYLRTNFRTFGSTIQDLFPANIVLNKFSDVGMFRIPKLLLLNLFSYKSFFLAFFFPFALSIFSIYKISGNKNINISVKIVFSFLIILSMLNLFGLALMFFIIFYLIDRINKEDIKEIIKFVLPALGVYLIFWTIFALNSTLWYHYFPNENFINNVVKLKVLWKEFLNYPFFYETYVLFRETMPKITYLLVFLLTSGTVYLLFKKNEGNLNLRILLSMLILMIFFVDTLKLLYFQTRYFFFFYPLILIVAFSSVEIIFSNLIRNSRLRIFTLCSVTVLILIFSEDFNLKHLLMIDSREVNYRVNLTRAEKDHYYPRWDTRTPAEFINQRLKNDEIVILNEQVYDYYLNKIDYFYYNYKGPEFASISVDKGKKERWTNANLVYTRNDFKRLLADTTETKWLLINTFYGNVDLESLNIYNDFKKYRVYSDQDSITFVYKIPPKPL